MKPKLIICLALVLSGGLFGCSTAVKHADEGLPLKKNTANELVPIFDLATPVANLANYEFLTNAIIDDDPPACTNLQFRNAYRLDLGLHEGPVLMIEFTEDDTEPASRWLAFFVGNTSQGYRMILPKLNLFFGRYQSYPQPPSTNTVYVNDADGNGQQDLLLIERDEAGEYLYVCYKYEKSLGIFEDYQVSDKSATLLGGWGEPFVRLSPEAYRQLREQGPVHMKSIGQLRDVDVSPASKHIYQPNGKSLRQIAAEEQAAIDDPLVLPSPYGTKILDYSNNDSPVTDGIVITDLGKFYSVRTSADTWPALVAKLKPTFAWNGCDLMWIENDTNGQPQFFLDEAYIYQPTNQPRQWILVKEKSTNDNYDSHEAWLLDGSWRQFGDYNLRANIPLQKIIPDAADNGDQGNYAIIKSADNRWGTVYEIGWQREMSSGNGLADYGRRIYVWEDRTKHWHFLGEGPEEGSQKGEWNTVESRVIWENSKTNSLPFHIRFHREETTTPYGFDADDTNPPPDVTICYDTELVSELPTNIQDIGRNPYLLAEKDDTLEKIISRLNYYWPDWQDWPDEAERQAKIGRAIEAWRAAIIRLNPDLPQQGIIKEGTRVDIGNTGDLENQLDEQERQLDALKKAESK